MGSVLKAVSGKGELAPAGWVLGSPFGDGDRSVLCWGCALVLGEDIPVPPPCHSLWIHWLFACGRHGLGDGHTLHPGCYSSCKQPGSSLCSPGRTGVWVSSGCAPCSMQSWAQRLCSLLLQMPMKPPELGAHLPRTNLPLHQSQQVLGLLPCPGPCSKAAGLPAHGDEQECPPARLRVPWG